ncbi:MAG TPA: hypothetical protein VM120_08085 [Bryobacteraceae bacterium]|nr:hypothetical protein [Bryobacteraceae bacterium]
MFRGDGSSLRAQAGNGHTPGQVSPSQPWPAGYPAGESTRNSRGLEQFLLTLKDLPTCSVLDLGGANQNNINYITNLGHRISSENVLHGLDAIWNNPEPTESSKIAGLIEQTFDYHESTFGGVLVWDTLQFLPPPVLAAVIERISYLMSPGGQLLAFLNSDEKAQTIPAYSYRIVDTKTMLLAPRTLRRREQFFNNRAIERVFQSYGAVKFFLTRDHLREVLVKR